MSQFTSHSTRVLFTNRLHLALGLVASVGLVGCVVGEEDSSADEAQMFTHPDDDVAGSQVRAVEGEGEPAVESAVAQTPGLDVSSYEGNVSWSSTRSNGARFAYVKATEGTTYRSPYFAQQYNGSFDAGLIRGAYHFATPNTSSGAAQATFFINHGGGWSSDGKTLPPALDMEYNPYGATCYGKTQAQMVAWVRDFANTVKARTGRDVVIYTSTGWWNECTGNNASFGDYPLWIPRYGSSVGALPAGWGYQTIWQYADHGTFPGDQNRFNGDFSRVQALAR